MRVLLVLASLFLVGCSPTWKELPYEVYYIAGTKTLGYSLGEGAYVGRVDEPKHIGSNAKYISVYACPDNSCSYFYIDKVNDHKYAEHNEFVFGPYTKVQYSGLESTLELPQLQME